MSDSSSEDDTFLLDSFARQQQKHYQSIPTASSGDDSESARKEQLRSVATAKATSTSKTDLKEIGKKTRRLLEEERKKRKEIVRLEEGYDESSLPPLPEKQAADVATKTSADDEKMKPQKPSKAPGARKRKRRRAAASNIDGWMPNVDDLLSRATTKDDRSNIVRLHGLPILSLIHI